MQCRTGTDRIQVTLGVDIGTSSSKGVLVDTEGNIRARAERTHTVDQPRPGWFEMDPRAWWDEFTSICRELLSLGNYRVSAVGASGMGPCVGLTDEADVPVRPAILYGVDTRAQDQIIELEERLGAQEILARCGSALTTQAVGPKIAWIQQHEPEAAARARHLYMPSSWIVRRLTGNYVLDHHSASQATPLYALDQERWYEPWVDALCPGLEMPALLWAGERAGSVTAEAAELTGLEPGTPVVAGTIDAWAEAASVGATEPGDLMLMYGTTLFMVNTNDSALRHPALWGTAGLRPGSRCLAGGLSTSGAITTWLSRLTGADIPTLVEEASQAPAGAGGLLTLPYFSGERTPLLDPDARGVISGLHLGHSRGDLYRSVLEGVGYAVRHNVETFREAGGRIDRVFAVGGGASSALWPRIVSAICRLPQRIPRHTVGASLGMAFIAASLESPPAINLWNPSVDIIEPSVEPVYQRGYHLFRELYPATAPLVHAAAVPLPQA
ncbi:FGGY-family carbohydrate kinase [Streptomyces sp. NPDC056061]|uniref:FGGY-family carbohydrate kinase n=1 Tax=Streptomyces sp. NPDC056061 TaxID=3345700 RepID=UPI0035E08137